MSSIDLQRWDSNHAEITCEGCKEELKRMEHTSDFPLGLKSLQYTDTTNQTKHTHTRRKA